MADTERIDLPIGEWVKIASGPSQGYIANHESPEFLIKEDSDTSPSNDVIGYPVQSGEIGYTYSLVAGQAVYCRASSARSRATHTQA